MSLKKVALIILSVAVLAVVYWLVSPLWRVERVSEDVPEVQTQTLLTGTFSGFDKIHNGSGTIRIIKVGDKTYVRFEDDFNITNGPDLYVGFGNDGKYIKGSEISRLKGNVGSQNYELEGEFDTTKYNEVWVWCKLFSVPFVRAALN